MQFGGARWSLGVPGCPRVLPGGCQVVLGHKNNMLESLEKGAFCPWHQEGLVLGVLPSVIVSKLVIGRIVRGRSVRGQSVRFNWYTNQMDW